MVRLLSELSLHFWMSLFERNAVQVSVKWSLVCLNTGPFVSLSPHRLIFSLALPQYLSLQS